MARSDVKENIGIAPPKSKDRRVKKHRPEKKSKKAEAKSTVFEEASKEDLNEVSNNVENIHQKSSAVKSASSEKVKVRRKSRHEKSGEEKKSADKPKRRSTSGTKSSHKRKSKSHGHISVQREEKSEPPDIDEPCPISVTQSRNVEVSSNETPVEKEESIRKSSQVVAKKIEGKEFETDEEEQRGRQHDKSREKRRSCRKSRSSSRGQRKVRVKEVPECNFLGNCKVFDVDDYLQSNENAIECLTESEIIKFQGETVDHVVEVLSIDSASAVALLRNYKWNADHLLQAYFDNPEKVCSEADLDPVVIEQMKEFKKSRANTEDNSAWECSICSENEYLNSYALTTCRHRFCRDCWATYLHTSVTEGQVAKIQCPQYKCSAIVPEAVVKQLASAEIYNKYCKFLTQLFVNDSDKVSWCPAPGCSHAVTAEMVQGTTVTCKCGYRFCFSCKYEAHMPATCEQLKNWKQKCQDASETEHWIVANTKQCPECNLATEKNGGCNHMICRSCKYEYCWVCMKSWKGHNDYYECNRYRKRQESSLLRKEKETKVSQKERDLKREEMRVALEHYLFYYTRFQNHARTQELEKIRENTIKHLHEMEETEVTGTEVKYINQALDVLLACRNALKFSYVVCYYTSNVHQREILEYMQGDLEKTAEKLTAVLETFAIDRKAEIINLTSLAQARLNSLLAPPLQCFH